MARLNMNANDYPETDRGFQPLPEGWYRMRLTSTEILPNRAGTGRYMKCKAEVLGPTCEGRVVFFNLTVEHRESRMADEIGKKQIASLIRAVGLGAIEDTSELEGRPFAGKVVVRKSKDERYSDDNDVVAFALPDAYQGPDPRPSETRNSNGRASRDDDFDDIF